MSLSLLESSNRSIVLLCGVCCAFFCNKLVGQESTDEKIVIETRFEKGLDGWEVTDKGAWKIKKTDSGNLLSLYKKQSSYKPKVRSPLHIAMLKESNVGSFQMDVKVLSTHPDYGHRDVCFFFGHQSSTEFYYVHLGKKMDPHANQIFIVDNAARKKISTKTTEGTNWDEEWHHVRIRRDVKSGLIEVFFDEMDDPVMVAKDKTFTWGKMGLGSFDDTADFAELKITGQTIKNPQK